MDRSKLAAGLLVTAFGTSGVTGPVVPANPQRRRFKSDNSFEGSIISVNHSLAARTNL